MFVRRILAISLFSTTVVSASFRHSSTSALNHPTGERGLLLIDKVGSKIRFYNPKTYEPLAELNTGTNPHDFVFSRDHAKVYVTEYGDGVYGRNPHPGHVIDIVDTATHKIEGTIDIAPNRAPHGIQLGSNGLLYVSCDLDHKVLIIDPKTRTIKGSIDTEGTGHWITLLPDGSKIFVSNKNPFPFVSVLDLKSSKMTDKIPMPNGTQGITTSPDGKTVIALDFDKPEFVVIESKTDKVIDRIPLKEQTKGAFKPVYSPDGRYLVILSSAAKSATVLQASNLRGLQTSIPVGKDPMGAAFSSDGKLMLVANHGDGTISVVDLTSAQVIRTFHGGQGIETIAFF